MKKQVYEDYEMVKKQLNEVNSLKWTLKNNTLIVFHNYFLQNLKLFEISQKAF